MSKNSTQIDSSIQTEKLVIKKDLLQTLIVNIIFIAALIWLNHWNQTHGQPLDNFISRFINL